MLAHIVASVCMGIKVWPVSNFAQQHQTTSNRAVNGRNIIQQLYGHATMLRPLVRSLIWVVLTVALKIDLCVLHFARTFQSQSFWRNFRSISLAGIWTGPSGLSLVATGTKCEPKKQKWYFTWLHLVRVLLIFYHLQLWNTVKCVE